jgi:tRNA (cytidine32/uridine32-2'-O)-methyltransferase
MSSNPLIPTVVLVEPREEGNIGSTARAMANMGLNELVLVNPVAEIGRVAKAFAVGAGHLLDNARFVDSLDRALEPYQQIVGTTSARARELPTPPIRPHDLPGVLQEEHPGTTTALVFGSEVSGLDNDHLARCGLLVRVPCHPIQPTLNLAQAVLIVTYELYMARLESDAPEGDRPQTATAGELEGLFGQLAPLLSTIGFQRDDTFDSVIRDLRRLAARAGATSREVTILRGICRRAHNAFERR